MLIETKLHAPVARREWVQRQELIDYLAGTRAKLILIDAPAGFGKTTLAAQWRSSAVGGRPFCWISLDRGDDDPSRLWWHVVSALHLACPGFDSEKILRALHAQVPDFDGTVLPMLVNELAALAEPVVLTLDDYHLIKEHRCHDQMTLLLAHLLIVAFWFGSLGPLYLVTLREPRERAARVVALFSAAAFWLVPLILVAGVAIAVLLLPSAAALRQPYGLLVIAKGSLFAVLLGLAAVNKWRFGPALGNGELSAGRVFRRMVIAEYMLIVVVLSVTAVMTTFFSPE